jgi:hypothetical protein
MALPTNQPTMKSTTDPPTNDFPVNEGTDHCTDESTGNAAYRSINEYTNTSPMNPPKSSPGGVAVAFQPTISPFLSLYALLFRLWHIRFRLGFSAPSPVLAL